MGLVEILLLICPGIFNQSTNKIKHTELMMERILTEPSSLPFQQSTLSSTKKAVLIKLFKPTQHNQQAKSTPNYLQPIHQTIRTKTQNPSDSNQTIKINTQQTISTNQTQKANYYSHNKNKNIFDSQYLNCLKQGYCNPYQQRNKITHKIQSDQFQGPDFYSQRFTQPIKNPQLNKQIFQQEIYKLDKNPKFMKFKVSLKRKSIDPSQHKKYSDRICTQSKFLSRVLITSLKTQPSQTHSNNKNKLSLSNQIHPIHQKPTLQSYSTHLKPKSSTIPQLPYNSNLFHSIKIFQKKQSLLGQIQSQKGPQDRYGQSMFQHMLRDRHHKHLNKNSFILKVHYDKANNLPMQQNLKSKFIKDIQKGKYRTNFKQKEIQSPLKLKGRTQTIPKYVTRPIKTQMIDDY